MAKQIRLTHGLVAVVDDEDYAATQGMSWIAIPSNGKFYAVHQVYDPATQTKYPVMLQRLLLGATHPRKRVWFIDGDSMNCRRANLTFNPAEVHRKRIASTWLRDGVLVGACRRCGDIQRMENYTERTSSGRNLTLTRCCRCARLGTVKSRRALRLQVLQHYGMRCFCCGETREEFLSVDHIYGDGNNHRRSIKAQSGMSFYVWLRKNGFPDGFRTACFNCNFALGHKGYCPHERERAAASAAAPCVAQS